ncbi:hypothetical protein GGS24DRAFT_229092 [Hypoxylon argillaceum]|nr:hypothetical protein GGS24DRAFT_229092 [Hypoxylon argillaceum]
MTICVCLYIAYVYILNQSALGPPVIFLDTKNVMPRRRCHTLVSAGVPPHQMAASSRSTQGSQTCRWSRSSTISFVLVLSNDNKREFKGAALGIRQYHPSKFWSIEGNIGLLVFVMVCCARAAISCMRW